MYQRVDQIVSDMSPVGDEFHDRLHTEILGELLEQIDLTDILEQAETFDLNHTEDQIDRALERARAAQRDRRKPGVILPGFGPCRRSLNPSR